LRARFGARDVEDELGRILRLDSGEGAKEEIADVSVDSGATKGDTVLDKQQGEDAQGGVIWVAD
jgi:hypothetical protein